MAELDFLLNSQDQRLLLGFIFEQGARLVPDLWYDRPEYRELSTPDEALDIRPSLSGPIFLTWENISRHPLVFSEVVREEGTFYFLCQKHGGPYLDLFTCNETLTREGIELGTGFIAYYTEYWVLESNGRIMKPDAPAYSLPIPDALKEKYRLISKFIRSMCVRLSARGIGRHYWVGCDTLEMLQAREIVNSCDLVLPK